MYLVHTDTFSNKHWGFKLYFNPVVNNIIMKTKYSILYKNPPAPPQTSHLKAELFDPVTKAATAGKAKRCLKFYYFFLFI